VLLDSIIDGHAWSASWQQEWSNIVSAAKDNALDIARDLWLQHSLFVHANTDPELSAELKVMIWKYSGWHWIYKDPALAPQPPAIKRLNYIAVPTIVVAGEHDIPDFREAANKLYHDIPNAQRFDVQGSGHMVNMESPDIVNDAILNFLGNISA
jgi:pimeloyl-ACP methyl ester carboxylesterase